MTYEEISDLLNYSRKESKIFISNDIFGILKNNINKAPHIAFCYSYIYLITWLFRYAKYFNVRAVIDNKKIKEILGYAPTNQTMDYLIKKNGLLDKIGLTESDRDYPVQWEYDEENGLSFLMRSEIDDTASKYFPVVPKRFFCKKPLLSLGKIETDKDGTEYVTDGTFFNVSYTHMIPFEVFLFCMANDKIGCVGFFLYSYLAYKNSLYPEGRGYDVSLTKLSASTGISERTVDKYIGYLKKHKMIDFQHNMEFYIIDAPKEKRKANTYIIRDHFYFSNDAIPYKKIAVKNLEKYKEDLKEREELNKRVEHGVPF